MSNGIRHRGELFRVELASWLHRFGVAPLPVPAGWYALPIRLIVGLGFVEHGFAKLSKYVAGLLALCVGGAGPLSVDGHLKNRL